MAKVHTQGASQASAESGMAGPGCLVLEAKFLGRERYSVKAEERWGNSGMDQGFPQTEFTLIFCPCIWLSSCSDFSCFQHKKAKFSKLTYVQASVMNEDLAVLNCGGPTWFRLIPFPPCFIGHMISYYPTTLRFHQPPGNASPSSRYLSYLVPSSNL